MHKEKVICWKWGRKLLFPSVVRIIKHFVFNLSYPSMRKRELKVNLFSASGLILEVGGGAPDINICISGLSPAGCDRAGLQKPTYPHSPLTPSPQTAVTAIPCQCAEGHVFHQKCFAIWPSPQVIVQAALELPTECPGLLRDHLGSLAILRGF